MRVVFKVTFNGKKLKLQQSISFELPSPVFTFQSQCSHSSESLSPLSVSVS